MKTTDRWVASADFHNRLWGSDRNHQHDTSRASGGSPDWWGCIWREWGRRASPLPAQSSLTGWGYLQHHHLWENDRLMLCNSDEIGQLVTRFQIKNHVKGLPVMRYLLIESCQVEFVLNVIFINLKQDKNLLDGHKCGILHMALTSQKNSFPRNPQNQEIQDTSSELLIFLQIIKGEFHRLIITQQNSTMCGQLEK